MKTFSHSVAAGIFHLGGLGMLIMCVVDSSFLTVPLANDMLVIAQSASQHRLMPYFAAMATAGSAIGCITVDIISRKAEEGLEKKPPRQELKFVERHIRDHAGWATAIAALAPPPSPFTSFVAAADAGYPREKLFSIIAAVRFLRFGTEGALAVH